MKTAVERLVEQISRTGSFDVPCSADTAFPLFSPEGEREWIRDWNPRPVFPRTIEFRRDTVFCTGEGEQEAVWMIVAADWRSHRAEYVRVATASHAPRIRVQVEAVTPETSRVDVSYSITVFGSDAEDLVEAFSERAYAEKMSNWQRQISESLQARKHC